MNYKNSIFVLYKRTEATEKAATKFRKDLANNFENTVIVDFDDSSADDDIYYESGKSSILLCLIDDELFYDLQCHAIWNSFWKRQRSVEPQIIFPVLIKKKIVIDNFDDRKKNIYINAETLGFYNLFGDDPDYASEREKEIADLYSDLGTSLSMIEPTGTIYSDGQEKNVHLVYEIDDEFISRFQKCTKETKQDMRFEVMDEIAHNLSDILMKSFKAADAKRLHKDNDAVCVLYTGGTAGLIHDPSEKDSLDLVQAKLKQLIPRLPRLKREAFEIDFYSFATALDSSNITSGHWLAMATFVDILKDKYQGFVIIHGANTMAYSASALSFLLDRVDKPIIFTGSELALTEMNTDAEQNIQRSIEIAAYKSKNELGVADVCLLFGRRLIRGNRATKQIALDTTEGFYSPNFPELASVSHDKVVIDSSHSRMVDNTKLANNTSVISMNKHMSSTPKVVIYDVYPDMDMVMFSDMCFHDGVGAVILRTYGTGGVPSESLEFIKCLRKLKDKHTIVVNITQCPKGNVEFRLFETNATLFNNGVISGGDMVTEAAYCKLKHLFSKFENFPETDKDGNEIKASVIKHYMMVSMRGELSMSMFVIPVYLVTEGKATENLKIDNDGVIFPLDSDWSLNPAKYLNGRRVNEYRDDNGFAELNENSHISSAVLRLGGVRISKGDKTELNDDAFEAHPKIKVKITNGRSDKRTVVEIEKSIVEHNRKYVFQNDSYIDINIEILGQARTVMKPPCDVEVFISCETHTIKLNSVNILLSAIKSERYR